MTWMNYFNPGNYTLQDSGAPQLTLPQLGSSLSQPPSLGNYSSQLDPYASALADNSGQMAGIAGAGIGAAGTTIGTLAQLMGQQFARNTTATQNQLGRALSEKLAKEQLAAQLNMSNKQRQMGMEQYLLGAAQNQISGGLDAYDTQRMANSGATNLIASAFTRR